RNNYMAAKINYERQRRLLMSQEDNVKLTVRQDARTLVQLAQVYELQKRNLFLNLRQKDNTLQQIVAPPGGDAGGAGGAGGGANATSQATQTINLVNAQNNVLTAQNALIVTWVGYVTQRLVFYSDLGIIPYDEWEAYYEFFNPKSVNPGGPSDNAANPGPAGAPEA